jgi:hypothetical protein
MESSILKNRKVLQQTASSIRAKERFADLEQHEGVRDSDEMIGRLVRMRSRCPKGEAFVPVHLICTRRGILAMYRTD